MAGTKAGGMKARETIINKYGSDYYRNIGSEGGKAADHGRAAQTVKEKYGARFHEYIGRIGGYHSRKDKQDHINT